MSYTELKIAMVDGPVITYQEYGNAWGGFAYIWENIWDKYLKKKEDEIWFTSENSKRLWGAVGNKAIKPWIRMLLATTFDNVIIEFDKLPVISKYYKDFYEQFPPVNKQVCHLPEWSKDCLKIYEKYKDKNCAGICFHATSINEDPWEGYDLSKSDKHWFVFEDYYKRRGLK